MAGRLLAAGYPVCAFDLDAAAVTAVADQGAVAATSPRAAAADADVAITMLPDGPAVHEVAFGADGLIDGWAPGRLWIEMSSSLPDTTRTVARAVEDRAGVLLDAPVSGGVRGAKGGTLTIMTAGPPAALERARPLLEHFGSTLVEVGEEPGLGDLAKTLNNLLSAINLTAAAEAVTLARRGGLDIGKLVEAVAASSGASHAMSVKVGQFSAQGRFDAGFTIQQYLKDLGIALHDVDGDDERSFPLSLRSRDLWQELADDGHGTDDHTRVVPLLEAERAAGAPTPSDEVPPFATAAGAHAAGDRVRRAVLGDHYVDQTKPAPGDLREPLVDLITRYCWGEVWNRPGLDRRARSLINLAMISALNRPRELKLHVRGAINNGLTRDEITEVVLQVAIYCGVPAAIDSMRVVQETLVELDAQET
jgi:3-hydroxyisobutyrate dehydrogenase